MKIKYLPKKTISIIIAFFLAILIFVLNILITAKVGVFRDYTIVSSLNHSKFYEDSYHEFESEIERVVSGTKIPSNAICELFGLRRFYIDARSFTQRVLNGKIAKTDLDSNQSMNIKKQLTLVIKSYYKNEGSTLYQKEIDQLSDEIIKIYVKI